METATKEQFNIRLDTRLHAKLAKYTKLAKRTKSFVATQAISDYLEWRIPQITDLQEAIGEADKGMFATDAEVAEAFARYDV